MLTNGQIERLGRLVRIAPHLPKELQEGLLKLIRDLRVAEGAGTMPTSVVADLAAAVPDKVCAEIVNDLRSAGRTEPGWMTPSRPGEPRRGNVPVPLESPPGLKYIDQMIDVADAIDKAERVKGFGLVFGGGPRVGKGDE